MENDTKTEKGTDSKKANEQGKPGEPEAAQDNNNKNQVTEASQKGKDVDRDITNPATEPEE